ncbi:MAG: hypothetical protein Q8O56_15550 [Solirubrobacteraceae bacterium]|nr:hypothetical protein [Solirubrobacteraceae bacterium]
MSAFHATASTIAAAVTDPGAGGVSTEELGLAGGIAGFAIIVLLLGGLGHRGELIPTLGWFERFAERVSGQPAWASLPCGLAIISLISSVFGLYWDVSLHIDRGRDTNVFGNPGHFFILAGLYGIFAAGFFAICLGREERADRPGPTAIRISRDWYAPLGGVLMCVTGLFSLIAFPLDDVWHRIFGQDVTLWGPTHLMLIGGAVMTLVAIAVIQVEVVRAMKVAGVMHLEKAWVRHLRVVWLPGGLLVGLSTFQGEFDFGVPQFQLVFHPMLIMLAAGVTLVATRIWLGRNAMFGAVAFFLVMRGLLALSVHNSLGEALPHFPLYIASALAVEAAAMLVAVRRPLAFGATAGALIGTIGLAAEWGWSHVWMPLPWVSEILAETIVMGLAMAIAASVLGAWIGARLASDEIPYDPNLRYAAIPAALAIFALLAFPLFTKATTGITGEVVLTNVQGGAERTVNATITLSPRDAASDAKWFTVTAWQGGAPLITDRLQRVSEGVYRTTQPIPVHGSWKTMVRLHEGRSITGLPIYAPADRAIPAPAVPAPARFERPFFSDKELLQREAKVQGSTLTNSAYAVVLGLTFGLLAMLAWGLHRVAVTAGRIRDTPLPEWAQPAEPDPQPDPSLILQSADLPDWARRPEPEADPAQAEPGREPELEPTGAGTYSGSTR